MDTKLEERLNNIENLIKKPSITEEKVITRQTVFTYPLVALQGIELKEACPLTGFITEVTMHWPKGCNALVDLAFGHRDIHMCPRNGYIALNNATPSWRGLHEPVKKGEDLWAELRNGDGANPHTPSIICTLVGVE